MAHSQNVGNNLLKYAMYIKLKELGFSPYIVGTIHKNHNISFLKEVVKLKIIKNFSEIKKDEFDILIVNSDQTWNAFTPNFYDIAFLKFANNWCKPKFVYGASLGFKHWVFSKKDEIIAKNLLKNFTGISVREIDSAKLIKTHLGFKVQYVLDPTLLINKRYYINLIKDYKSNILSQINNKKYIFAYILKNSSNIKNYLSIIKTKLNIPIFYVTIHQKNQVKEFLYGIFHSRGVVTNSFHGTVFSIIFNKPFATFRKRKNDNRINNLINIFGIKDRVVDMNSVPNISLLKSPLIINKSKLKSLKSVSIQYLKKHLYYNKYSQFKNIF